MHLDTNYLHPKNQQSTLNSSQENNILPKFRGHTDEWRDKVNYRVVTEISEIQKIFKFWSKH